MKRLGEQLRKLRQDLTFSLNDVYKKQESMIQFSAILKRAKLKIQPQLH